MALTPDGFPSFDELRARLTDLAEQSARVIASDGTIGAVARRIVGSEVTHWADSRLAAESADAQRRRLGVAGDVASSDLVMDSFDSMSHEEMVARTGQISSESVAAISQAWSGVADLLAPAVQEFRSTIADAIGSGWEGSAATAAASGVDAASRNLAQLARSAAEVADTLEVAGVGFEQTRRMMPPAEGQSGVFGAIAAVFAPSRPFIKGALFDRSEQREEALSVLKAVYAPTVWEADTAVPVLAPAIDPTRTGGAPRTDHGDVGNGDADTGGAVTGVPGVGWNAGVEGTVGGVTGPVDDPLADPAFEPSGHDFGHSDPTPSIDTGDRASGRAGTEPVLLPSAVGGPGEVGTVPATAVGGTAGISGVSGPGGQDAAPSGRHASGTGFGSGASVPGFGSGGTAGGGVGVVGAPGASASGPGGVGGSTGGASAGRTGGTPGMGMLPAARGAGRDDESEHSTPGYLVTADNGTELVGNLPRVAPPVLGA